MIVLVVFLEVFFKKFQPNFFSTRNSRSKAKTTASAENNNDAASTGDADSDDDSSSASASSSSSSPLPAPATQQATATFTLDPQFVEAVLEDRKKSSNKNTSSTTAGAGTAAAASKASPNNTSTAFELDTSLAAKILADRERDVWRERTLEDDGRASSSTTVPKGAHAPHSTAMPTQLAQYKAQANAMAAAADHANATSSRSSGTFQLDPSLADKIIADRHADVWHKRGAANDNDSDSASNSRSSTLRAGGEGTTAPHSTVMPTQLAQYKSQVEAMKSSNAHASNSSSSSSVIVVNPPPPTQLSSSTSSAAAAGGGGGVTFELDQALAARILADRQGDVWNKRVAAAGGTGGADSNSNSASNRLFEHKRTFLIVCVFE